MGVDVKLFTSTKNSAEDIIEVLKIMGCKNVKYKSTHSPLYARVCFEYKEEKRMLSFFHNCDDYCGITTNMMSLGSNGLAKEIIKGLAKVFGGFYQENDCENNFKMYEEPGAGDLRWLVKQYYKKNLSTPRNSDEDIENFIAWSKER